jgi:hypothetical protein
MAGIDYTKLRQKLTPEDQVGGDPGLQLRVGTIQAIASDGTVTLNLSGVNITDVNVLDGAVFSVGTVVQVLSYRGSLLVIGASNVKSSQPVSLVGVPSSGVAPGTSFINSLTAGGGGPTTGGIHGVAFIAPPSGTVLVMGRAVGGNETAGQYGIMDFEVKTGSVVGSGGTIRAGSDNAAGGHQSATNGSLGTISTSELVTGLTPGAVYNAALVYRSSSASGTEEGLFNRRYIAVLPQ